MITIKQLQRLFNDFLLSNNLKNKIYKTIILPVVLYGCKTWTLTIRKECRLRLFEEKDPEANIWGQEG